MRAIRATILITLVVLTVYAVARQTEKVGEAAPLRDLPWWIGSDNVWYTEHECTDGMALWLQNPVGPNVDIVVKQLGQVLIVETHQLANVSEDPDFPLYEGEFRLEWDTDLVRGSKVLLEVDTYESTPDGSDPEYNLGIWLHDCHLPATLNPEGYHYQESYEFAPDPIPENGCVTQFINIDDEFIPTDLDFGLHISAGPSAYFSAFLESPSGTKVQLFDKDHQPAFRLGSTCTVGDLQIPLPDLIFDDDSTFSLADGVRPYNGTSFAPSAGELSAFNGENANGIWKLEVCHTSAPTTEQEEFFQNGDFESGDVGWLQSSTNGLSLIHHSSNLNLPIPPQNGEWLAWLGGADLEDSSLFRSFLLPDQLIKYDPVIEYSYQIKSVDECGYDFSRVWIDYEEESVIDLCLDSSTTDWTTRLASFAYTDDEENYIQHDLEFSASTDYIYSSSMFIDNVGIEFLEPGSQLECWLMDFETAPQQSTQYIFTPMIIK
jgi:hypothetical protein